VNSEIKAEWLEALRSGEYQQGRENLAVRREDGSMTYCCLGVLCDLAVRAGVDIDVNQSDYAGRVRYEGEISILPYKVMEWAGLYDPNPQILPLQNRHGNVMTWSLAELNDGSESNNIAPYTFEQIAAVIEEKL
jgi:hypothetical protein